MMKKSIALIILFSAAAYAVSAQKKHVQEVKAIEWSEKPVIHDLPPQYNRESALMLAHDVTLDYRYEGKGINVYYTQHRLVKVLDDKGIEMFNTVSIPVNSRTRVPLIKARTILPDGKVIDIPKEMIKVTRNENGQYEIVFAMEGVVRFAEVELLLQEIRSYAAFGSEVFQYSVPVASTHFEISYPRDLVFEEKGYNGFPDALDTLIHNRRHISISAHDIPALHREPASFYDLHRQRAEYRIHKFIDENEIDTARIFTWNHFSRRLFDEHYTITEKERAAVNKYLITLGARPTHSDENNVRLIEDGIKNDIVLYPDLDNENADMLDSIIAHKAASASGYIKLFAACFTQCDVTHKLGMAYNRKERRFDPQFENWGNMDTYLFYFPGLKKFLCPLSEYTRYPVVPEEVLGIKGVFCTLPPKRDNTGPLAELKTITPLEAKESHDNIAAAVTFNKDMDAQVEIDYSYTGYAASPIRKELMLQPKSKEKEMVNHIVTIAGKPSDIEKYTISNPAINCSYKNLPLEITATVNTGDLTERAGKDYLFKLGALIGPRSNLYHEKNRELPIDFDFPHTINDTITINIPKGYKIMNLQDINRHADYVNRQLKPVISFDARYSLITDKKNGDKLIVTVTEYYPQTHFAASEFERFRSVINTAADFSKVTLLLSKKS